MTPVSLSSPGPSIQGQQNQQLFDSQDYRALFNMLDQRQTIGIGELRENHDHQDDSLVAWHDGSSSNNQLYYNSSFITSPVMDNPSSSSSSSSTCDPNLSFSKKDELEEDKIKNNNVHGSEKWMSSKMRLMKKMMRPAGTTDKPNTATTIKQAGDDQINRYSQMQRSPRYNNNTIRVCSDCNTSTTPLWRSGPNGPKSLCNACGIRQRKARRAMAEAANGLATPIINTTPTKTRVEKKPRTNHIGVQLKNKSKSTSTSTAGSPQVAKKLECFKDFTLMEVFPRGDEVAEAAMLLMDLSCGYVHS